MSVRQFPFCSKSVAILLTRQNYGNLWQRNVGKKDKWHNIWKDQRLEVCIFLFSSIFSCVKIKLGIVILIKLSVCYFVGSTLLIFYHFFYKSFSLYGLYIETDCGASLIIYTNISTLNFPLFFTSPFHLLTHLLSDSRNKGGSHVHVYYYSQHRYWYIIFIFLCSVMSYIFHNSKS